MTSEIETYNYAEFEGSEDWLSFRTILPVGSNAPDFTGIALDGGQPRKLSEYWAKQDLLIEFGSFT